MASHGHDASKEAPEGMLTEEDDVEIHALKARGIRIAPIACWSLEA